MTAPVIHGVVERLTATHASGWAVHPAHPGYPLLIHAIVQGTVAASTLADLPRDDGLPGFTLDILPGTPHALPLLMAAETGEILNQPGQTQAKSAILTLDDILALPVARDWVNGACHIDASRAGLRPETIIDMLCRDYLGLPADGQMVAAALAYLRPDGGGFDGVRRMLIASVTFKQRRPLAADAPGVIFSQRMLMDMAPRDYVHDALRQADPIEVSARALLALDGHDFIAEAYRQLVRKEADQGGMDHYLYQLHIGRSKRDIIVGLANETEAIMAGVRVIDLPPPK